MDVVLPMFSGDSVCCQLFFKNSEKFSQVLVELLHNPPSEAESFHGSEIHLQDKKRDDH